MFFTIENKRFIYQQIVLNLVTNNILKNKEAEKLVRSEKNFLGATQKKLLADIEGVSNKSTKADVKEEAEDPVRWVPDVGKKQIFGKAGAFAFACFCANFKAAQLILQTDHTIVDKCVPLQVKGKMYQLNILLVLAFTKDLFSDVPDNFRAIEKIETYLTTQFPALKEHIISLEELRTECALTTATKNQPVEDVSVNTKTDLTKSTLDKLGMEGIITELIELQERVKAAGNNSQKNTPLAKKI